MKKELSTEQMAKNKRLSKRIALFFALPLIVLFIIVVIIVNKNTPEEPKVIKAPEEIVHKNSIDGSVEQVEDYLRANLNDAESYKPVSWSKVFKNEGDIMRYYVRHSYRAKNGFGGYILKDQMFYMDSIGCVVLVKDNN